MSTVPTTPFLEEIAAKVRAELDFPEEWVRVTPADPFEDQVGVSIALQWQLEDVGGPESGPKLSVDMLRWMHLVREEGRWQLWIYGERSYMDMDDSPYPSPELIVTLEHTLDFQVADHVVAMIRLLGIRPGEA